jgi:hypothetical protein
MSLTIGRLVARYKVPLKLQPSVQLIDGRSVGPLVSELRRLTPKVQQSSAQILRIRRLTVRLQLSSKELEDGLLEKLWAEALVREIGRAIAGGANTSFVEIVRAKDRADWLAQVISEVLSGGAVHRWQCQEFHEILGGPPPEVVLALFAAAPSEIVRTLLAFETRMLERLFSVFDDTSLARLFSMLEQAIGVRLIPISIEDLLTVGRLVSTHLLGRLSSPLGNRRHALHLFLALAREGVSAEWPPTKVIDVLGCLTRLLELNWAGDPDIRRLGWGDKALGERTNPPMHPPVLKNLDDLSRELAGKDATAVPSGRFAELTRLLAELQPIVPLGAAQNSMRSSRFATSECAGLFLLVSVLNEQRWAERLLRPSLGARYGSRLITYSLAGLALAVLNRFSESVDKIDPGLALFAGWLEEPDLGGLRRFFASESSQTRRELLIQLLEGAENDRYPDSWAGCFDCLAARVIHEFTRRIRGFSRSRRSFAVKSFFALPGRIRVEETRLIVTLAASPFNVVLHLSGTDDPVESVDWLGGRRIEFQVEGL